MFGTSTQKKHWTFSTSDPDILKKIRWETYNEYLQHFAPKFGKQPTDTSFFLTFEEEQQMVSVYEQQMNRFCKNFRPPLPPNVVGSAFHYYKRFYLNNSPMNYHPKDSYPTCLFLACKIDEYNLSIDDFVKNYEEKYRPRMTEVIINNETLVICCMKFHLIIHNPYRPIKGILVDLEMQRPDLVQGVSYDQIMPIVNEFLEKVFYTDIIFLYAPSQIALSAIFYATNKKGITINSYVEDALVPKDKFQVVSKALKEIRHITKRFKFTTTPDQVIALEAKLERCRNPENNIDCESYCKPMEIEESIDDDDDSFV